MSELLEQQMRQLKLGGMAKEWRSIEFHDVEQYVGELLKLELHEREVNRINRMVKSAGFHVLKTLDDFVWNNCIELPVGLTREYMTDLSFLNAKENLIFMGTVGTGKTHLATAIALKACQEGRRVRFFTAASLANMLLEKNNKGMDGFFDKFSIYDFFNLIGSGMVFLMGLVLIGVLPITELMESIPDASNWQWLLIIGVLGVCYLLGTLFQQISSLCFEKRYCNKLTSMILCENGTVIDNEVKLKIHQRKARELFKRKGLQFEDNDFSEDYCNYYFAYCSYYIQNQNNHHKAEKMRGLRGMYALLLTCFFFLILACAAKIAFCLIHSETVVCLLHINVSFIVMFVLCIRA